MFFFWQQRCIATNNELDCRISAFTLLYQRGMTIYVRVVSLSLGGRTWGMHLLHVCREAILAQVRLVFQLERVVIFGLKWLGERSKLEGTVHLTLGNQ